MPRKKRDPEAAKRAILASAVQLLQSDGAAAVTVEAVAKSAKTAKGLVLYHYKTKQALLEAAGHALLSGRLERWRGAFDKNGALPAIENSWRILTEESKNGVALAWASLLTPGEHLPDQVVKNLGHSFAAALGVAGMELFRRLETQPRIRQEELAWILSSLVSGVEAALVSGADPETLNAAYSAAWLAVLSLADVPQ